MPRSPPPALQANASRFQSFNSVNVSSDGHDSVEIGLDQLTPSSVARVFSVSPLMVTISGQLSLETGNSLSFADLIYDNIITLKKKYPQNSNLRWGQWSSWPE